MKILLTGSSGYIGSKIFSVARERHEVVGIDVKQGTSVFDCLHPKGKHFDRFLKQRFDCIIHTAATPRIPYSMKEPLLTAENNIISTSTCLNFCKISGCKKFIFSSSSSAKYPMNSPYSLQKSFSEKECRLYSNLYGIQTSCLRYFNVYSDYEYYMEHNTVLSRWMKSVINKKPLEIHGDGEQRRDMVHIDDVVSANLFFAESEDEYDQDFFEIGTGKNISINELFRRFSAGRVNCIFSPSRKNDVRESLASESPYKAKISISEGIEKVSDDFWKRLK